MTTKATEKDEETNNDLANKDEKNTVFMEVLFSCRTELYSSAHSFNDSLGIGFISCCSMNKMKGELKRYFYGQLGQ